MKFSLRLRALLSATALILATWANVVVAGTIFTNEAAFDAAISGFSVLGTENFDSLSPGLVANPSSFMGGLIELGGGSPSIINTISRSAPNEWIGATGTPATITGVGGSALGFDAFAFPNRKEFNGTWTFLTSLGTDVLAQGLNFSYSFLGWVGAAGETLSSISYSPTGRIALDDLAAYSRAVPIPSSLLLIGLGLAGIGYTRSWIKAG
ncbi:MAG: hypothetical protein H6960_09225 [Chromatiaceae bacterium]|nr:hypothetical protein [Chromatiaceae bacterium]